MPTLLVRPKWNTSQISLHITFPNLNESVFVFPWKQFVKNGPTFSIQKEKWKPKQASNELGRNKIPTKGWLTIFPPPKLIQAASILNPLDGVKMKVSLFSFPNTCVIRPVKLTIGAGFNLSTIDLKVKNLYKSVKNVLNLH